MERNTRAAIYARLSVNRSGDQLAIKRQVSDCTRLITRHGFDLVATYSDDNKSAWHEHSKRPGYDALCESIRRGELDVVVVYETDRLARRLRPMLDLFDVLLEFGVTVHSVKSGIIALDSPFNIAQAQMKAVFAETYVNDARDKNLRKRRELAENGTRHAVARIYGWNEDNATIRESEASVVREITQRLTDGQTSTRIARELNERGIPTVKGSTWTGRGVRACAERASNAGLRSHHGTLYDGTWEPIVTRVQWERVCSVMSRPETAFKRGTGRKYWLTGFAVCGVCYEPLTVALGRDRKGVAAYRCDPKRRGVEAAPLACGGVVRSQDAVDWYVKEMLIRRLSGDEVRAAVEQAEAADQETQVLVETAREQRQRIVGLVDDYASGLLDRGQLARAKAVAEAELKSTEQQIAQHATRGLLGRMEFSESVRQTVENADTYWLMDAAEALIKRVIIKPQGRSGWKVKLVEIDGRQRRFDPDLVEIEWQ